MIHRHRLLCLLFLLAAHVTGCHTARPVPDARANAQIQAPGVPLDTGTVVVQPPRTLLQKLTNQPAAPAYRLPATIPVRIGKKSQVTIIHGSGNTVGQTGSRATAATGTGAKVAVAGKNSTQATDSAAALNTGGGAAAVGTGASASGGATTTKSSFWQSPAGYLTAAVLAGIGGYGLYLAWPVLLAILPKRRKEPLT